MQISIRSYNTIALWFGFSMDLFLRKTLNLPLFNYVKSASLEYCTSSNFRVYYVTV